ncbi:MAG TPA: flavodoxin family protein [Candidatus Thermoplasmatota archaeon]|nr:flavodoxin family protein [Candidatus Thermoplasmatota archaeon]
MPIKSLVILFSYHHKNTEKIANVIAKVLDCEVKTPTEIHPEALQQYDLIGFGSGIYGSKHHTTLLDLTDTLPPVTNKNAFIFSTFGAPAFAVDGEHVNEYIVKAHSSLKEKLQSKGYTIVDEFICPGYNTNSFLKLFGGINKGRPNAGDLKHAEKFAINMKKNTQCS